MKQLRIGEVLQEGGYVSEEQVVSALAYQKENPKLRLGQILVDMGFVTEKQMLLALGQRLDLQILDLFTYKVDEEAAARLPKEIALKYLAIPIAMENSRLVLAINDPLDFYAIEDIRLITTMAIDVVLSEKAGILAAIEYYYSEINAKKAAATLNSFDDQLVAQANLQAEAEDMADGDSPVVKLLNSLLVKAYNSYASDVHIEPFEDKTIVRMRIDGMIVEYINLAVSVHQSLIARIKIMSSLDIAEKRLPQDGHFKTRLEGIDMNVRVSVIPTVYGEKAVLRFLSTNVVVDNSGCFGMSLENYNKIKKILHNPHGIVYITGSTGSGKTTTLYMILEYLTKQQANIVTIEDPVERNVPKVNQMQVNTLAGLTFDSGLRAILRQDPDIIMVGETRDNETAAISVRAAITGHLVISTLHTNDSVSAIVRLADMGIEPYLTANSLVGVVAQRLVKKICPHCKRAYTPTQEELEVLGEKTDQLYRGEGCHICNNTGYRGRQAIHEIIEIDSKVKEMISNQTHISKIYDYYENVRHLKTLRSHMIDLVKSGVTTIDELINVTYYVD